MAKISTIRTTILSVLKNLSKLLSFAWKTDKVLTFGFFTTAALSAFFPIITSYIYKLFVDNLIGVQGIAVTIPFILIILLGARFVVNITWDFINWGLRNTYFDYLLRYKIQNKLSLSFFKKVSSLDVGHYENPKTQDLIIKAEDSFLWRNPEFLRTFGYLFTNLVSYTSAFLLLLPQGWWIPIVITFLALPRLYLRTRYGKLQWSIYSSNAPEVRRLWYLRWILSHKETIVETKVFQSQKYLLGIFSKIQDYLFKVNKKPVGDYLKVAQLPLLFEASVIFGFAYFKLPDVLTGAMSVGGFTFFLTLLDGLSSDAAGAILNFGDMYENNLYVQHFFDVMKLSKLVKERRNSVKVSRSVFPPRIEFKNVSFSYPGSKEKALKNINFAIEPSENIAIVGENGAGKTTIVKLLCRFYDVTSGEILVNGVNIKQLKLSDWYKYLGTLFQDFQHYHLTVKENIFLGNSKVRNIQKMRVAARQSGADRFIRSLPKKYDQILGREYEEGEELSQGQWQKLAIARAFYEEAPILIMDEPTSAIDAEAEYEIFQNLKKFYKDKTLFLISHRFSTVRNADKIIVLDKGKIIEEGDHKSLLGKDGVYSRMFEKQAKGYQ